MDSQAKHRNKLAWNRIQFILIVEAGVQNNHEWLEVRRTRCACIKCSQHGSLQSRFFRHVLLPMEIDNHRKGGNEDLQQADLESIWAKENKWSRIWWYICADNCMVGTSAVIIGASEAKPFFEHQVKAYRSMRNEWPWLKWKPISTFMGTVWECSNCLKQIGIVDHEGTAQMEE